jgi:hypothetical protein
LALAVFVLGVGIFGVYQFIQGVARSLAGNSTLAFDRTGSTAWCGAFLQSVINRGAYTYRLGTYYDQLESNDCAAAISIILPSDWQEYKEIYRAASGGNQYLPKGVDNVWTSSIDPKSAG